MLSKSDRIVVTGAAGLMGSAVVERLQSEGFEEVIPLTRADCDLMDTKATNAFMEAARPAHVFHAAARVYGVMGTLKMQGACFYDNVMINTNVIEAARRAGARKVTVMGTGSVYPEPAPGLPLKEDMIFQGRPHFTQSGYANAKRAMLSMLEAYGESYGLRWAYLVSCNLFGPRDRFDPQFGNVIPSLIKKFYDASRDGGSVTVWGDGSAQRDFIYIKDAARAALCAMDSIEGAANMGSGSVQRIGDMVRHLGEITGLSDRIVWDTTKPNGQGYRGYDLTRIDAAGFKCRYTIREGLQETWDWYCAQHDPAPSGV